MTSFTIDLLKQAEATLTLTFFSGKLVGNIELI
jgi:hypothetical protein